VIGVASSLLLAASLFMPWFSLTDTPQRVQQGSYICGDGNLSCPAWDTFPIAKYILLLAAISPIILIYFIITGEKGKYPTGEATMTIGMAVITIVIFNGIIQKPKPDLAPAFGISLDYGYWLALLAGLLMAGAGAFRSLESGGGAPNKPPGVY